jgi:hypothetical protein
LYSSGNVDITDTDVKYCICGMGRQYSWKLWIFFRKSNASPVNLSNSVEYTTTIDK